jgi:hypothetical protein
MHTSPKAMAAVKTVFGFGLGLLGVLIAEPEIAALPMAIVGTLVGAVWGGGLIYWWHRSRSTSLYAESFAALLVLMMIAVFLELSIWAACALGGYGLTLMTAFQIREWRGKKPISWQDLRSRRKA